MVTVYGQSPQYLILTEMTLASVPGGSDHKNMILNRVS